MTRKHFVQTAKIIKDTELTQSQRNELAVKFAAMFKAENDRFDNARFMAACGC